jgi:predicted PhzF superfamily epimerase YddE/YHI9
MSMKRSADRFAGAVVDAFVDSAALGNPAGVVLLEAERSGRWMQRVAAEFNQAETAFLIEKGPGEWGLRWFTPTMEVGLCGHATLAAVHWLAEQGLIGDRVSFQTAAGTLTGTRSRESCTIRLPERPVTLPPDDYDISGCFRGNPDAVVIGATGHEDELERNLLLRYPDEQTVRGLVPGHPRIEALPVGGVIVTAPSDDRDTDIVARYFAPRCGIPEDPVTGSAYCTLIGYWSSILGRPELTALQVSPRQGRLRVARSGPDVYLTGKATTTLTVAVPAEERPLSAALGHAFATAGHPGQP